MTISLRECVRLLQQGRVRLPLCSVFRLTTIVTLCVMQSPVPLQVPWYSGRRIRHLHGDCKKAPPNARIVQFAPILLRRGLSALNLMARLCPQLGAQTPALAERTTLNRYMRGFFGNCLLARGALVSVWYFDGRGIASTCRQQCTQSGSFPISPSSCEQYHSRPVPKTLHPSPRNQWRRPTLMLLWVHAQSLRLNGEVVVSRCNCQ